MKNYALLKCITDKTKTTENGFIYESDDVQLYKIVDINSDISNFKTNDVVMINSTGTHVSVDGEDFLIVNANNMMAKVVD